MKFAIYTWCFLIIFFSSHFIYADINSEWEDLFIPEEESEQITEKTEELLRLKKDKIDINKAVFEELVKLPWLSPIDVDKILEFRKDHNLKNKQSLKNAGISSKKVNKILPYIEFEKKHYPLNFEYRVRTQYSSTNEYNPPLKFYQRVRGSWKNYSFHFLNQKDSGEKNYLDYYSGSLVAENLAFINKLVVGNYRLSFGQGIIFSPKLGLAKGYNTTKQPIKSSSSLRSNTSASENFSLFGTAARFLFKDFSIIPYYSNYDLDATIENYMVTSIYDLGYHRTDTEKEKKDKLNEQMYGCNITYGKRNQISLHAHHIEFEHPFADNDVEQINNIFGIEYRYFYKNYYFFGESAYSKEKFANIAGIFFEVNDFKNLLIYRNFENHFPTFHGNPFHVGGEFDNEHGIYCGIDFNLLNDLEIRLYFDLYKFPAGSFYTDIPSYGTDKLLAITKKWQQTEMRFIYKNDLKEKWKNVEEESKLYQIERSRFRLDIKHDLSNNIRFKFRIEYSFHDYIDAEIYDKGFLLFEEIRFDFTENLKNYFRIAQYHSGDIQIFMYENDINGVMQNSQFQGDGIAGYFLLKYDLWQHYSFQFKYSQEFWKRETGYHTGFERQLGKAYKLKAQLEIDF